MKKLALSLFTIITFSGFGLYRWLSSSANEVTYSVPPETTQSETPAPSPTPLSSTPPTPTSTSIPTQTPLPTATPTKKLGPYVDGQYIGSVADAYYGNVQVEVSIKNGIISNVQFLQYPNDRSTSREINGQAMPDLIQEAIQSQNSNVDIVSGATDSSGAFRESLASALSKAQ